MEIRYRQKNLTMDEKVRIVTDYNAGMSLADIMKRYEISQNTIYRTLRSMAKKGDDNGSEEE